MRRSYLAVVLFSAILTVSAVAQDAVPVELLTRTFAIRIGSTFGTAFAVEHKNKLYFVTARHVVSEVPMKDGAIEFLYGGEWRRLSVRTKLLPPSTNVDIAVLVTGEAAKPFTTVAEPGATMGQNVFFLGYPYGLHSRFTEASEMMNWHVPFIKRGTMSAIAGGSDATVLYIDGFNNPGFSGGPIIAWDFSQRVYRIIGVVQGYREESAKVIVNGAHVDTELLVNSGILIGYSIKHATDAIAQFENASMN